MKNKKDCKLSWNGRKFIISNTEKSGLFFELYVVGSELPQLSDKYMWRILIRDDIDLDTDDIQEYEVKVIQGQEKSMNDAIEVAEIMLEDILSKI